MHSKENYKQGKKTTFRMGENNSKWNNWQRIYKIYMQLIQLISENQTTKSKSRKKTQADISPKKTYRWLMNTWKDAQHYSLLEKCKSKLQRGIISHWSEWASSKSLQTINAGESVEKSELSYTLHGNTNWYSHYGEQCGDSLEN